MYASKNYTHNDLSLYSEIYQHAALAIMVPLMPKDFEEYE